MLRHPYPRPLRHAAIFVAAASATALLFAGVTTSSATAMQAPSACVTPSIVNGSFEAPLVAANNWALFNDSLVDGWTTTASDRMIEIWRAPFGNVPVPDGAQFAELNATQRASLFQDVATTPGQSFQWQFQHRGRTGVDVMELRIGAPGTALDWQATISNGQTWGTHSGLYTVPAGQTTTRVSFDSISSANGSPSYGNFLDAVSLTAGACVITSKSVVSLSGGPTVRLGDTLQYSIVVTNSGASDATLATVVDALPAGITLVPGSLTASDGVTTTALTDIGADDNGEYDAASREVRARVGAGASSTSGGTLTPGASATVTFSVVVDSIAALPAIDNSATSFFTDALSNLSSVSTSNTTSTMVTPDSPALTIVTVGTVDPASRQSAADLGDLISWSYVVENTGDVTLSSISVVDPEGGSISCSRTTLAVGESATCSSGTHNHTVTEADLGVGSVSNGATAVGTPPFGAAPIGSAESIATVTTAVLSPSIALAVFHDNLTSPGTNTPATPGDRMRARFAVTNTGNATVDAITIFDPVFGPVTCTLVTLPPGGSTTCVGDALYVITAQDGAARIVSRTITATGSSTVAFAPATVSDHQLVHLDVIIETQKADLASTGAAMASPLALALLLLASGFIALGAARVQSMGQARRTSLPA